MTHASQAKRIAFLSQYPLLGSVVNILRDSGNPISRFRALMQSAGEGSSMMLLSTLSSRTTKTARQGYRRQRDEYGIGLLHYDVRKWIRYVHCKRRSATG